MLMHMMCNGGGCVPSKTAYFLMVVGGVNWGLVGIGHFLGGNWNLVNLIFGTIPALEFGIYVLVGVAAVMHLIGCKCAKCQACMPSAPGMESKM